MRRAATLAASSFGPAWQDERTGGGTVCATACGGGPSLAAGSAAVRRSCRSLGLRSMALAMRGGRSPHTWASLGLVKQAVPRRLRGRGGGRSRRVEYTVQPAPAMGGCMCVYTCKALSGEVHATVRSTLCRGSRTSGHQGRHVGSWPPVVPVGCVGWAMLAPTVCACPTAKEASSRGSEVVGCWHMGNGSAPPPCPIAHAPHAAAPAIRQCPLGRCKRRSHALGLQASRQARHMMPHNRAAGGLLHVPCTQLCMDGPPPCDPLAFEPPLLFRACVGSHAALPRSFVVVGWRMQGRNSSTGLLAPMHCTCNCSCVHPSFCSWLHRTN